VTSCRGACIARASLLEQGRPRLYAQRLHRRIPYGIPGASSRRGHHLCSSSMSRGKGTRMASHRTTPTRSTAPSAVSATRPTRTPPAAPSAPAASQQGLKRTALYARVSTEKQEREETVASQVDLLYQAAAASGYDIAPTSVFIDEGVSFQRIMWLKRNAFMTLALSICSSHDVSSLRTVLCMEMRHGPDRQSATPKSHDYRRLPR